MADLDKMYDDIMDTIATSQSNLLLINLLKDQGKAGSVIKACLKLLEFFPDDIAIRKTLAETYLEQGNTGLAEGEIDTICRKINELSQIYKLQAKLFQREGRLDEAIEALRLYAAHCPDDQEAKDLLSELTARLGEEKSVLLTPTMAEIYFEQGEIEEAITIYKEIVKAFPDDRQYRTRLNELENMNESRKVKETGEESSKEKKLKMLGTMEKWLEVMEKKRASNP